MPSKVGHLSNKSKSSHPHPGKSSSSSQPVSSSSGSPTTSSESKSTKATGSNENATGTVQTVDLEPSRPGIYKRIACVRYVRPMMPCMYDSWGCPMQMPYSGYGCYNSYGYAGEFPPSTRALIIPPKSKNLYRNARDEDFESNLKNVDVNASFLKIHVPDDPKPPKMKTLPPPPPPPKKKPKVDKSHLLKKFLHESHSKIEPKKKPEHHKEEKKEEKKAEKESPKTPKEEKHSVKSASAKASTAKKPSSSSSSDKTVSNIFVVTDAREHHFDQAVKRRGSSFDAVASHTYQVKTAAKEDPVAPMGFHNDLKNSIYQDMPTPTNAPNATTTQNANNKITNVLYYKGLEEEPHL
ncbi:hypothetical protein Ocin01_10686 [Orchesella cincta]|uniref:Uncharacterized protein n=1 Tax=Orchesella cincta TaxID=48709 RepID=A0A1D2MSJ4_ORCCI|nr:hypothetical protein Ocin01_10686 [Orchesella cincta]